MHVASSHTAAAASLLVAAVLAVAPALAMSDVTAAYDGQLAPGTSHAVGVVGALTETHHAVSGSLDVALADSRGGVYRVDGVHRGRHVVLRGANGAGVRFLCRVTIASGGVLHGSAHLLVPRRSLRAHLILKPRAVTPPAQQPGTCDSAYFRDTVMAQVLVPVCGQCHVPAGVAAATNFRVTANDPLATQRSVALNIDVANPATSRILQKPLGQIPHGGGRQIVPGSAAEQILRHWVDIVVSGQCGGKPGGGGTGNPAADLYTANCASCHGTDARGGSGKPDVHCSRAIHDVVRNGQAGGTAGDMPAFPNLSDADIATLQMYLDGLCPAPSGGDLYASNCATCHGADGGGTATAPTARCATRVADALATGRGTAMPAFPSFTPANVSSVSQYLDQLCTAAGVTGADLYAANCSTCHGPTGGGGYNAFGAHGPDIQCYDPAAFYEAVQSGQESMPAFPALDAGRIAKIIAAVRVPCGG